MDLAFSAISGATAKLYDDLIDNDMLQEGLVKRIIYLITTTTLTAVSYNDFIYSTISYIMNVANYLANPDTWEENDWKALFYIYPLFLVSSFRFFTMPTLLDIGIIIFCTFILGIEPLIIDEEFSVLKLISRIIIVCNTILAYFLMQPYVSPGIQKVQMYIIGYAIVSILFQIYFLYIERKEVEGRDVRSLTDCVKHAYEKIKKLLNKN
jgi:hypothetical protein